MQIGKVDLLEIQKPALNFMLTLSQEGGYCHFSAKNTIKERN